MSCTSVRVKFICRLGYGDALPKDEEFAGGVAVFGSNGQYATTSARNTDIPAIVLGRKGSYGKVNWAPDGCFASDTTFFVDERLTAENLRWLFWSLQTLGLDEGSQEAAVPGLNRESVYEERICLPSLANQVTVANYLDRETARIDGLIAEKKRMLTLLEEKRAALISRVVTRGLDPNAPLKPSGQHWLGEIPAHWEIQPIKYLAVVGNGSTPSVENADYWHDEGYPWLNSSVVNVSPVTNATRFVTETALRECHLPKIQPPAVLVGITGQGKTRGMAAVLGIEATINQHVAFIKPRSQKLDTEYLCYSLGHAYAFLRSDSDGAGSTKGAITCEQLANMKIPVPPSSEQIDICTRIRQSLAVSKPLRAEIQRSLDLLTERRSALITAAVTGQIPQEEMRA
ncbi:restriction endonuclease S subunits [Serpentinimonas maccroryi]|uniref:Restriction endonuclease S subunits n=1 Tax=Serpentinimonas maccroryi TaxID=1458426 RepID=A0A060NTM1_9BURK|nr:restriction endonuclease subunit S [Serpentinimonas maccroryi]BAO82858.1 restriction endonuclease S subunits [Serpentinimonas maccroryi]